ncbi:hypothetical protein B0H14DRAFT_3477070 [Mycena olivaceomarginata]|nr:hypothetical protein B0H14DRAFT_3477070 [Mycena olivaceomarginata]
MHRTHNTGIRKGSGSSGRLRMLRSERKSSHSAGRALVKKVTLSRQGVDKYCRQGEQALRARLNDMQAEELEGLDHLQSLAEDENFHAGDLPPDVNMINMEDVLDGSERIELSHGGGEFLSLEQDLEANSGDDDDEKKKRKVHDWKTHRDHTEIRNRAFLAQMDSMVMVEAPTVEEIYEIQVVDMFDTKRVEVKLDPRG